MAVRGPLPLYDVTARLLWQVARRAYSIRGQGAVNEPEGRAPHATWEALHALDIEQLEADLPARWPSARQVSGEGPCYHLASLARRCPVRRTWQIQEAKNKLSEVIEEALESGPQVLTRRGEEVAVLLSMPEYLRLKKRQTSLSELFRQSPLAEVDLERDRSFARPGPEL